MNNSDKNISVRISFNLSFICIITFIVFLILKLCNVVAWSWLVVCIPLIVLASAFGLFLLILFICVIIAVFINKE